MDLKPSVRISDVAARAGVSDATVSRVLNAPDLVASARRERVLEAVSALNYRPNRQASSLRRQRVEMIGAVVSNVESPHFGRMVRAIEAATFGEGYRLLLCNTDESAAKQRAYLEMLAGERVSGVVLSATDPAAAEISELLDFGIPVLAIDRPVADPRADAVLVGNHRGARLATEHLLEAGHTQIGFIGGPRDIETADDRSRGYVDAMEAGGLEPRVVDGHFRVEGGHAAAETLLAAGEVTALVAANDLMTIGMLQSIRARGLEIPDDLAVVAIDDPFWCALMHPPIDALAQPIEAIAERAVSLLLARVGGRRQRAKRVSFDLELRARGSVGPPSSRRRVTRAAKTMERPGAVRSSPGSTGSALGMGSPGRRAVHQRPGGES